MSSVRDTIFDNLKSALEAIQGDTDYEIDIAYVTVFDENVLRDLSAHRFPMVMIIDTGTEELIKEDSTHYRYRWEVILRGVVTADTMLDVHDNLNKMITTLKKFIDAGPSLGSNSLATQYRGIEGNRFDPDKKIADTLIRMDIIYQCTAGTF